MADGPEDKLLTHIDASEIQPELRDGGRDKCPDHPNLEPEVGFGLAGGGYGPYTYCGECGRMLSKTEDGQYD